VPQGDNRLSVHLSRLHVLARSFDFVGPSSANYSIYFSLAYLMKKILLLLLILSLAANAVWLSRTLVSKSTASVSINSAATKTPDGKSKQAANAKLPADLAAALASGDAVALKAAGFSEDDARSLTIGRAFAKFAAQMKTFRPSTPDTDAKYWKNSPFSNYNKMTSEQRAAMNKAQRELSEAMRVAMGDDADLNPFGGNRYGFLPAAKRDELRRIEQDYGEMTSEIYRQQDGIQLPSDRAKMKLLREEKERDIAAALTPEEYQQYQLHDSSAASSIRSRFGDVIQNEDDYKKIFALQKNFDDKYPNDMFGGGTSSKDEMQARSEAQRKLNEDIRAAIGEENYAAFQRANDTDYKSLNSLQTRLNLPTGTADQVYALRDTYATQSQAINANAELSFKDRRDQLNALATQAKNDLVAKLGQEGADAYAQRAQWMQFLKNGSAFSTNAKDAPNGYSNPSLTVYPVRPAMPTNVRKASETTQ